MKALFKITKTTFHAQIFSSKLMFLMNKTDQLPCISEYFHAKEIYLY